MKALIGLLDKPDYPLSVIGTRHGEKLFESLISLEEMSRAKDLGGYYMIPPDLRDLNYEEFVEKGEKRGPSLEAYNSHNTERLDISGMQKLLIELDVVRALRREEYASPEY